MRSMVMLMLLLASVNSALGQRIGLLNKMYESILEVPAVEEFELNESQVDAFLSYRSVFYQHNKELIAELVRLGTRSDPTGKVPWEHLRERVDLLNREILANTKKTLGARDYGRFQELMTQKYLREFRFEEAAALHGKTLDNQLRRELRGRQVELLAAQATRLEEQRWELLSGVLATWVDASKVAEQAGERMLITLPRHSLGRDTLEIFDPTPLRLALYPRVQAELALNPKQLRALDAVSKSWRREDAVAEIDLRLAAAVNSGDPIHLESEEQVLTEELRQLNERLRTLVRKELKPEQWSRLRQLMFQFYVQQQQFERALEVMGESRERFDRVKFPNDPLVRRFLKAAVHAKLELRYVEQLDRLQMGITVFDRVVGDGRTRQLIGEVCLVPEDPYRRDADLRQRLAKQLGMKSKPVSSNPRRE